VRSWDFELTRALKDMEKYCDLPEWAHSLATTVGDMYDEPGREYHNKERIFVGLDTLLEMERETPVLPVQRISWMLHNCYYDAEFSGNEALSAGISIAILGDMIAVDPILSTQPGYVGRTIAGKINHDLNHVYFAASYESVLETTARIRLEYRHLTDEQWAEGRAKFVESLDPQNVFWHPWFIKRYGKDAFATVTKLWETSSPPVIQSGNEQV